MKNVINFIKSEDVKSLEIYNHLKCSDEEVKILQYLTRQYIIGNDNLLINRSFRGILRILKSLNTWNTLIR